MNEKIRNLERALMQTLNASELPLEVKRIILGKLEAQITNLSNVEILREAEEKENAKGVQ